MVVDYFFRVVHAAVTDLDCVSVEDFSELVIFWESVCLLGRGICVRCWCWCSC